MYKKPKLYLAICITYSLILAANTVIYFVGFALISQPSRREVQHNPTRIIFLTLRGITILGCDLFACLAMPRSRVSQFWIGFGFTAMSLTLSVVNSALDPSFLSRIDLDFDIMCFFTLLVLIREAHQLRKQQERRVVLHGVQADYRC